MSLYYEGHARNEAQLENMRRLEAAGLCLFCPPALADDPSVVHRTEHWAVRLNDYPYPGTRHHYMLSPYAHVEELTQLPLAARGDFWTALEWLVKTLELDHYGLFVRSGRPEYTAGTIRHLHIHVLQGEVGDPTHEGVRIKLSSRP